VSTTEPAGPASPARRRRGPRLRTLAAEAAQERHATWLELFFDLCFVAAVAALAADLHHDPTWGGIARFCGLFVPVWWAWMGYTWYASAFDNDDPDTSVAVLGSGANSEDLCTP